MLKPTSTVLTDIQPSLQRIESYNADKWTGAQVISNQVEDLRKEYTRQLWQVRKDNPVLTLAGQYLLQRATAFVVVALSHANGTSATAHGIGDELRFAAARRAQACANLQLVKIVTRIPLRMSTRTLKDPKKFLEAQTMKQPH